MRLVLLSDTHMNHDALSVPPCDVLVHAGDFCRKGSRDETEAFFAWFGQQPARARVVTAGNHDFFVEKSPGAARDIASKNGSLLLLDESAEVEGLRVHASPVTPSFGRMAFNRNRGASILEHWSKIPPGLDLLITHGPPRGLGDRIAIGLRVGCDDLLARVRAAPPRLHVFGHIHEARGEYRLDELPTRFLNVASQTLLTRRARPAVALAIDL